jgi:hypothetical protein
MGAFAPGFAGDLSGLMAEKWLFLDGDKSSCAKIVRGSYVVLIYNRP